MKWKKLMICPLFLLAACAQNHGPDVVAKHASTGDFKIVRVHDGSKTIVCVEVTIKDDGGQHVAISCNWGG